MPFIDPQIFIKFNGLMWASAPTTSQLTYRRDTRPRVSAGEDEIIRNHTQVIPYGMLIDILPYGKSDIFYNVKCDITKQGFVAI